MTKTNKRQYQKFYMRDRRAKQKAAKETAVPEPLALDDAIGALAKWSAETLVVPPGHSNAGQPLTLPAYLVAFLSDAMASKESLLCLGRKNAKSCAVAVLLLGLLVGPLRFPGMRAGVASISKEKAGELKKQMQEIAEASGLEGLTFYRSPAPGRVESSTGSVDLLASETGAHSSSYDYAIFDEVGLIPESQREFVASLRSSTSAKNGKFLALSIWGFGPFIPEIVARRNDPGVAVHLYQAPEGSDLADESAWLAANPGLGEIKSLDYMRRESKRVLATPNDQAFFRSHDLNCPQNPTKQMIFEVGLWKQCIKDADRAGDVIVGFDLGGSAAMCSLVAYWPESGRVECYAAFPQIPDLEARGKSDGIGSAYTALHESGDLWTYPGRVTPVAAFLKDCAACLDGERVIAAGADRYRRAEAQQAMEESGLNWAVTWRGTGSSATADGSHDCRSAQAAVLKGELHISRGAGILTMAVLGSALRFDQAGNPALDKQKGLARIDPLQALVISCGLAALVPEKEESCFLGSAVLV